MVIFPASFFPSSLDFFPLSVWNYFGTFWFSMVSFLGIVRGNSNFGAADTGDISACVEFGVLDWAVNRLTCLRL